VDIECKLYPLSKTQSNVLPFSSLFSVSASSESTGISAPTWGKISRFDLNGEEHLETTFKISNRQPAVHCHDGSTCPDVITIRPLASSRLSAMMVPWE
jgi:hypothetical protein